MNSIPAQKERIQKWNCNSIMVNHNIVVFEIYDSFNYYIYYYKISETK